MANVINEYHLIFKGIYGYRRMTMVINKFNQTKYSKNYIYRIMKAIGVKSKIRRVRPGYKRVKPEYIEENILARSFEANKPNEKWLSDVTEFKIEGSNQKLYLCAIYDLFDNSVISFNTSKTNNNNLVFKTFDKAIKKHPKAKPLFHSDRGFQYTSKFFKRKIESQNMIQSMSRVGKCIDNGPMEGFWGIIKSEMYYDNKFDSYESLDREINRYIKFYNNERIQVKFKGLTPIEYRHQASVSN